MGNRIFWLFLISVLFSLVTYLLILVASQATFIELGTFWSTVSSKEIIFAIGLSLFTATISSILAMTIAMPVAYALSRLNFPMKNIVDTIIDIPIVLSPIAVGTLILMFFHTPWGSFIETHIHGFVFSVSGIVLAQFTVISALAIRLLKSTFDGISLRYEHVARFLGSSSFRTFYRVTLPLAKNGLIASFILTWARALGEYGATVTVAGAVRMKTETLPIGIYLSLASVDLGKTVVLMAIMIVLSLTVLTSIRVFTRKGVAL